MTLHWQDAWQAVWNSPYLGLFATLMSFQLGLWIFKLSRQHPFMHPVLISVLSLCALVYLSDLSFERYMESAQMISFFLGPVIVALAIPLYQNLAPLKRYWLPFILANLFGGAITIGVAVAIVYFMGGSDVTLASMWTKSITTAFALQIAPQIGGLGALAAAIIMFTGIMGAVLAPALFRMFGITNGPAQGCALGICAHAVGTAKALEYGSEQGAFAALSMSIMGILCALLSPFLLA